MASTPFSEFSEFIVKVIAPAQADLENLKKEENRVHVQKAVYTNLVDRFDSTIDEIILTNCREPALVEDATKDMDQPLTEASLIKFLLHGENIQGAIDTKLKDGLRAVVLRQRHSKKVAKIFKVLAPTENCLKRPRVNTATGGIGKKIKPTTTTTPQSICGYADWLYSRRNSIVHGAGTTAFLENDKKHLKELYGCTPGATFRIKLNSISTAAQFYQDALELLEQK